MQYCGLVFGALYGVALSDQPMPLMGGVGVALIPASGIAATVLRERAVPDAPAGEH